MEVVSDCCQRLLTTVASTQRAQLRFENSVTALVDKLAPRMTSVEGAVTQLTEAFSSRPLRSPVGAKRSTPSAPPVVGPTKLRKVPLGTMSATTMSATTNPPAIPFALSPPSPMLRPGTPIDVLEFGGINGTGAIGYMEERFKGRPDVQTETTRGAGVYHSFKSVLLPGEEDLFSAKGYAELMLNHGSRCKNCSRHLKTGSLAAPVACPSSIA